MLHSLCAAASDHENLWMPKNQLPLRFSPEVRWQPRECLPGILPLLIEYSPIREAVGGELYSFNPSGPLVRRNRCAAPAPGCWQRGCLPNAGLFRRYSSDLPVVLSGSNWRCSAAIGSGWPRGPASGHSSQAPALGQARLISPASRKRLGPLGSMGTDPNFETFVLRLLCAGTSKGLVSASLIPLLRTFRWSSTLRGAIFSAIVSIPSDDPAILRQLLPARLTRMGFPDVEWEELFTPVSMSSEEAIESVRKLLAGA